MNDDSDQRLLVDFLDGDEDAFRRLVERHSSLVHSVSMRVLMDHEAVADVFQITFLQLVKNASSIRKKRSLAAWLYAVAYRNALRVRTRKSKQPVPLGMEMNQVSDSTLADLHLRYELDVMDEEINKLPSKLREPLVLHYLMGKPQRVVAEELGLRASTVKGRLQRGKNWVRLRLVARGVSVGLTGIVALAIDNSANADLSQLVDTTVAAGMQSASVGNQSDLTSNSHTGETTMVKYLSYSLGAALVGVLTTISMIAGGNVSADSPVNVEFPLRTVSTANQVPLQVAQIRDQKEPKTKAPSALNYGDNEPDGKKSFAGSGQLISFELPSKDRRVRGIKIHGSRYGYPRPPKEDIRILFLDEDMKKVLHKEKAPYSLFKRGESKWNTVRFRKPIELPEKFWIALDFNAERTKGVYVSYDTSTKGKYSRIGLPPEQKARETSFAGDWMVQVLLSKPKVEKSKKT